MGGNPQLGPRVKDSKKAARAIGSFKKSLVVSSGLGNTSRKENVHPNFKWLGQDKQPLISEAEIASIWFQQKSGKNTIKSSSSSVKDMPLPKEPTSIGPMMDPNPLMGFIEHLEVDVNMKEIGANISVLQAAGDLQQDTMLSEKQPPHQSQ